MAIKAQQEAKEADQELKKLSKNTVGSNTSSKEGGFAQRVKNSQRSGLSR